MSAEGPFLISLDVITVPLVESLASFLTVIWYISRLLQYLRDVRRIRHFLTPYVAKTIKTLLIQFNITTELGFFVTDSTMLFYHSS